MSSSISGKMGKNTFPFFTGKNLHFGRNAVYYLINYKQDRPFSACCRGIGRRVECRDQLPGPFRVLIPLFRKIVLRRSSPGPVFTAPYGAKSKEGIYA